MPAGHDSQSFVEGASHLILKLPLPKTENVVDSDRDFYPPVSFQTSASSVDLCYDINYTYPASTQSNIYPNALPRTLSKAKDLKALNRFLSPNRPHPVSDKQRASLLQRVSSR